MPDTPPQPPPPSGAPPSTALAHKEEGNARMAAKDHAAAVECYRRGLAVPSTAALQAVLHSNTAQALLQLGSHSDAAAAATCALACADTDAARAKALYRRAAAHEGAGKVAEAFKDLKAAARLHPTAQVKREARRVKEKLTASLEDDAPLPSALRELSDAATPAARRVEVLRYLTGAFAEDVSGSDAGELQRRGGVEVLLAHALPAGGAAAAPGDEARLAAVRALASACGHDVVARHVAAAGAGHLERVPALVAGAAAAAGACRTAVSALVLMTRVASRALGPAAEAAVRPSAALAWASALSAAAAAGGDHDDDARREVTNAGLEGLMQWTASDGHLKRQERQKKWALLNLEERTARQAAERTEAAALKGRALAFCACRGGATTLRALAALAAGPEPHTRVRAASALARLVRSIRDEKASKRLFAPLLEEEEEGGGGGAGPASVLEAMKRRSAVRTALLLADEGLGVWALRLGAPPDPAPEAADDTGAGAAAAAPEAIDLDDLPGGEYPDAMTETLRLCTCGDADATAVGAEVLCTAASFETGRVLLAPAVESGVLYALLDSDAAPTRAAAAAAVAKLGLAAKALAPGSEDTGRLLRTAMELLKSATDRHDRDRDRDDGDAPAGPDPAVDTGMERAVEVLAALIGKTEVKEELGHGSGRCVAALPRLVKASLADGGRAATCAHGYGLALVFSQLTVTNQELRRRAIAEKDMDVTPEQLDELQKLTKQKVDGEEETDSDALCAARIRAVAAADGGAALVALSGGGASDKTLENLMLALAQMATEKSARGTLVQQGALAACAKVANDPAAAVPTRLAAAHAVGRCLISTNPHVLTESQRMGAVKPLVWLCHEHAATDLAHFEALLALTNLGSVSAETKGRICAERGGRGVATLHYLMFSDHELVRRAATEALSNLWPHPDMAAHLCDPEKAKLWLAVAGDWESDVPTGCAAAGLLANAAADAQVAAALRDAGGARVFAELAAAVAGRGGEDPASGLAVRAEVALENMAGHKDVRRSVLEMLPALQLIVDGRGAVDEEAAGEDGVEAMRAHAAAAMVAVKKALARPADHVAAAGED